MASGCLCLESWGYLGCFGMLLKYPTVQRTVLNRDVYVPSKMSTGLKKPLSSNPHSPESGGSDPDRVGDCHLWVATGATMEGSLEGTMLGDSR